MEEGLLVDVYLLGHATIPFYCIVGDTHSITDPNTNYTKRWKATAGIEDRKDAECQFCGMLGEHRCTEFTLWYVHWKLTK